MALERSARQILVELARQNSHDAARALLALLREMAATHLYEPRSRASFSIPLSDREDTVADTALRLIARFRRDPTGSLPDALETEGVCWAFLRTALVRSFLSIARSRHRLVLDEGNAEAAETTGWDPERIVERAETVAALANEIQRVADAHPLPEDFSRSWREMVELRMGIRDVGDLVSGVEGVAGDAPRALKRKAEARIRSRHMRARESLLKALDRRVAAGLLPEDLYAALKRVVEGLKRTQDTFETDEDEGAEEDFGLE